MKKYSYILSILTVGMMFGFVSMNTYAEEVDDVEIVEETVINEEEIEEIIEEDEEVIEVVEEPSDSLKNGWNQDVNGWFYVENGNIVTGWKSIKGYWYYLDPNNNGYMVSTTVNVNGKDYFFDGKGHMVTGWVSYDGNWYYCASNGSKQTGWIKSGNNWYYLDESGIMVTGIHDVDGTTYFFNQKGAMIKNGWVLDNDSWYFIENNSMKTGWVKSNNVWYYLDPETGIVQTGRLNIGDVDYFFGENGKLLSGWVEDNGNWYYTSSTGKVTGWKKLNGSWYYLDPNNDGIMASSKTIIDDKEYFFGENGKMLTGWVEDEGNWYYLNTNGTKSTGWVKSSSHWYYMDPETGIMTVGTITIDGNECTFGENGAFVSGTLELSMGSFTFNSPNEIKIYGCVNTIYASKGTDLKKLFHYVADNINYKTLPIPLTPPTGYTRVENYAIKGLKEKQGNCYCYASAFYYLAKGLGYDATYVEGGVLLANGGISQHGWVEIVIDGKKYVCDPEGQHELPRYDLYMQPIDKTKLTYIKN